MTEFEGLWKWRSKLRMVGPLGNCDMIRVKNLHVIQGKGKIRSKRQNNLAFKLFLLMKCYE